MIGTIASILIFATVLNPASVGSQMVTKNVLATHTMSMTNRYGVESVNSVFKDNILLNLAYLNGSVKSKADIDWDKVRSSSTYEFILNPGEEFAYHDKIGKEYLGNVVKTTNAHFNYVDGFKSDGYLMGDGVCHFASLIYWAAKDAGLEAYAPTNHNFAVIPEVPKEYGVSIYMSPDAGERNNLYIFNNKEKPVTFEFKYENEELRVSVMEI